MSRSDWTALAIAAAGATAWLVIYWGWIALHAAWRKLWVGVLFRGHSDMVRRLEQTDTYVDALIRDQPLEGAAIGARRQSIVEVLRVLDRQARGESSSRVNPFSYVLDRAARRARGWVRSDLHRADAVLCVMASDPEVVTSGALTMAGAGEFDRSEVVAGLMRALSHGLSEEVENALFLLEQLIDETQQLDRLRKILDSLPDENRSAAEEAVDRVAARMAL